MDAMGAWVLKVAQNCGIPVRIAHSHNTKHLTNNPIKLFFLEQARKKSISMPLTEWLAPRWQANGYLKTNLFQIIRNAIEAEMFKFNSEARRQIRQKYNIKNNFLIGHVGRFDTQKNHMFLLDVFAEIHKTIPKSKLILIGEGHLKEAILQKISTLNLKRTCYINGS